jgi:hypothetical protein
MPRRLLLILTGAVLTALIGCGTGEVSGPDAGHRDGDVLPGDDGGSTNGTRLTIEIEIKPSLPADVGGPHKIMIEEVVFDLTNVRVIGDSAPGDARTTIPTRRLTWSGSGNEEIDYPDAPPGIYSTFIANVENYQIRGDLDLPGPGGEQQFEIDDTPPGVHTIIVSLGGVRLEPNQPKTIKIDFDLGDGIKDLPWDTYPIEDGMVEVDEDDSVIDEVRAAVLGAFSGS